MRTPLFTAIALLFSSFAFNQMTETQVRAMVKTAVEQELLDHSSQMIQEDYFYHAEIVVDALLKMKPESSNYNYRKGFLVLNSRLDYETAIPYLEIAIKNTSRNYDNYSTKEASAPNDAFYHLARCYHLNQELDAAITTFNKFIEITNKKSELIKKAELMIEQCLVAKELIAYPKNVTINNIGSEVNSDFPEYSPVISLDGTSLYFTSRRPWEDGSTDKYLDPKIHQYPEDIYVSYLDFDEGWTSPEKLDFCDNLLNEATIAVSSDEKKIYVYKDETGAGDIYYSDFKKNAFEELIELGYEEVNTEFWETHCTMTPDGQTLYFVSDRPGGLGGRDIYRIVKLPNGQWSKALNLGPKINSPFDEDSPFIDVNNRTLYYSSNGKKSMGGFDIFVTFRDDDNNWSEPVNMGYPINSTGDDVFYTTTVDGLKGYLSSFRKDGYGEKDIYEVKNDYLGNKPFSILKGSFILSENMSMPKDVEVRLTCLNCDGDVSKNVSLRIKKESYYSLLNRCKDYKLEFFSNNGKKLLGTETFSSLCNDQNETIKKDFYIGLYTLAGTVADSESMKMLIDSKVEFLDPKTKTVISSFNTNAEGAFSSDILQDKKAGDRVQFLVQVSREGYLNKTFEFDTVLGSNGHIQLSYMLSKSIIGADLAKTIHLNPIYFDLDKSNIRPDAALELDKIVKIMNDNPSLEIELGSHTDCRATEQYNLSLSNRRAKSSADYIRKRITNPKRIYGKGYGESRLVNNCACEGEVESSCSDEEHQANRRTEFRIVKN